MQKTIVWRIDNFHCSSCVLKIQNGLKKIPGVVEVMGDFTSGQVSISYDNTKTNIPALMAALKNLGYPVVSMHKTTMQVVRSMVLRLLFSVSFVALMFSGYLDSLNPVLGTIILATGNLLVMFWAGGYIYERAYRALLNKTLSMYSLISLSTIAAWVYSVLVSSMPTWIVVIKDPVTFWDLPAFVISLIIFGEIIEKIAQAKVQANMEKLLNLKIEQVRVMEDNQEKMMASNLVKVNDVILIKPGEQISLDGVVIQGQSMVNEANITGESRDVEKTPGSRVFSGSINKNGILYVQVSTISDNSTMAHVIKMVRESKLTKLPIQNTVDYVASIFVPLVVALAVAAGLYWLIVSTKLSGVVFSFSIFLCTLLIACPCALGLATPLTITTAFSQALKRNILIKSAEILSKLVQVRTIVFDKTGTLTTGNLTISKIMIAEDSPFNKNKILSLMGQLSQYSSHPLSRSLYEFSKDHIVSQSTLSGFHSESGAGILGIINGQKVFIGNQTFLQDNHIQVDSSIVPQQNNEASETFVMFAVDNSHLATVFFDDQLRSDIIEVIEYLRQAKIQIWLLSGDNQENTTRLCNKIGILYYMANANPVRKLEKIKEIRQQSAGMVCMVGDGINDAAALSEADVSVCMNNGVDITLEASEIVLINNQLASIPYLFHLSHKTIRNIKQNLVGAFIYNILCIPVAMGFLYSSFHILLTPLWATVAMICSSLTVTLNSLRMLWDNYTFPKK